MCNRIVERGRADTSTSLQAPLYRSTFFLCLCIAFPSPSHHPSAFFFRNHNDVCIISGSDLMGTVL